jgi:excisionase family DNA binding protein
MPIHATRTALNPPPREWLSLREAATILGISVDTLRRSVSSGKLPASRLGRRLIRVRITDLERLYRPIPAGDELPRWRQAQLESR